MSKPTELKLGRFHYKLDPQSGFWCAQFQTDPQSATVSEGELIWMARDWIKYTEGLLVKVAEQRDVLIKQIGELEDGQKGS